MEQVKKKNINADHDASVKDKNIQKYQQKVGYRNVSNLKMIFARIQKGNLQIKSFPMWGGRKSFGGIDVMLRLRIVIREKNREGMLSPSWE